MMTGVLTGSALHALIALLLPAFSFLVLAIVAPFRRLGRPAAWFSTTCAAAAFVTALIAWHYGASQIARVVWPWLPSGGATIADIGVLLDAQSSVMLCLVTLVSFLVQFYSLGYLHDEPAPSLGRYYAYQSLFAFSMIGLALAPNLLQLFMCWELVGLCSYLLIGYWYQRPSAARAAVKAFWITKAGDVGLLIGIVMLWRLTGTFDLQQLRMLATSGAIPVAGLSIITFAIYMGAMGKSAQFPFHVWLPDAMEGPTPVSALIHAATMVTAGVYLLVRTDWLFALTPNVLTIVAWIGAFTALLAAVLACVQDDIKRVLAYSTVSQLGYMMTAIGAGVAAAGFLHLLTHGLFKALLFLGAGAVIHAVGSNDLPRMGGLARRMPQTALLFIVGTLSLAGIPLFGGFLSKEEILGAVWTGGLPGPFALLMLVAFLTAFYMFRVVFLAFFGVPVPASPVGVAHAQVGHGPTHGTAGRVVSDPASTPSRVAHSHLHNEAVVEGAHVHEVPHAHEPPATMLLPLWVLALMTMAVGVYTTVGGAATAAFFVGGERVGAAEHAVAPGWLTPAAVGAGLAGILLAWLTYQTRAINAGSLAAAFGPIRSAAIRKFWIDDVFEAIYGFALLGFSRIVGWIDRYIVDGVLNVLSDWTVQAGDELRGIQTGKPQDYVYGVATGVLVLVLLMRLVF
jgi:NADH-quinone oxidoreductase subunit L